MKTYIKLSILLLSAVLVSKTSLAQTFNQGLTEKELLYFNQKYLKNTSEAIAGNPEAQFQLATLFNELYSKKNRSKIYLQLKDFDWNCFSDPTNNSQSARKEHFGQGYNCLKVSVTWAKRAAIQGHVKAQVSMAKHFDFGIGVEKNIQKAFYWYDKAAKSSDRFALARMGESYLYGTAHSRDYLKAKVYLERSLSAGSEIPLLNLGKIYHLGWGVDKNLLKAEAYYIKAIKNFQPYAGILLGEVYREELKEPMIAGKWCYISQKIDLGNIYKKEVSHCVKSLSKIQKQNAWSKAEKWIKANKLN